MSVSLLRPQVLTDTIYIIDVLADAILVLLYIIGARNRNEALGKKKLLRKFGGFKKLS